MKGEEVRYSKNQCSRIPSKLHQNISFQHAKHEFA
jgi:hypothetical protein